MSVEVDSINPKRKVVKSHGLISLLLRNNGSKFLYDIAIKGECDYNIFRRTIEMNTQLPGYYTIKEMADYMGVDERTVERWIVDGKITVSNKVGHLRLVSESEVERFRAEWVKGRKTR